MGRRFHIPFFVDLLTVREPAEVRELATDPRLDRGFIPTGPLINRLLSRRIRSVLTVNGIRLPAVAARADERRAREQCELRQRLDALVLDNELCEDGDLAALANAIQGKLTAEPLGILAHRVIGKLFAVGYVADAASVRAAKDLHAAASERNLLRYLTCKLSGKIAKARCTLFDRVSGQSAGVHGTGIAVHSLIRALERMRSIWRRPLARTHLAVEQVVRECIVPPQKVLRQVVGASAIGGTELRHGALVIVNLKQVHRRERTVETAFMQTAWSHCPAATFVPALLAAVWKAALSDRARTSRAADPPDLPSARTWEEIYEDGGAEAESVAFDRYALAFLRLQAQSARRSAPARIVRAAYADQILATDNAELTFLDDLPKDLRAGFAQPGKHYKATVRFSSHADSYGIALRVTVAERREPRSVVGKPPGLSRPQRTPVRRIRQGGKRQPPAATARARPPHLDRGTAGDGALASVSKCRAKSWGPKPEARILLECKPHSLGRSSRRALCTAAAVCDRAWNRCVVDSSRAPEAGIGRQPARRRPCVRVMPAALH